MSRKTVSQLFNETDAAKRLGMSVVFLRNMRAKPGKDPLPFMKVGASVRYSEADMHDWLERRRVGDAHQGRRLRDAG